MTSRPMVSNFPGSYQLVKCPGCTRGMILMWVDWYITWCNNNFYLPRHSGAGTNIIKHAWQEGHVNGKIDRGVQSPFWGWFGVFWEVRILGNSEVLGMIHFAGTFWRLKKNPLFSFLCQTIGYLVDHNLDFFSGPHLAHSHPPPAGVSLHVWVVQWPSGNSKSALDSGLSSLEQSSHPGLTLRPLYKQTNIVNKYVICQLRGLYMSWKCHPNSGSIFKFKVKVFHCMDRCIPNQDNNISFFLFPSNHSDKTHKSIIMIVGRDRKICVALGTNQIAGFIAVCF